VTDRWVCWTVLLEAWHVSVSGSPSFKFFEVESGDETFRVFSITLTPGQRKKKMNETTMKVFMLHLASQ